MFFLLHIGVNGTIRSIDALDLVIPVFLELSINNEANDISGSTDELQQLVVRLFVWVHILFAIIEQELADVFCSFLAVELACNTFEFFQLFVQFFFEQIKALHGVSFIGFSV